MKHNAIIGSGSGKLGNIVGYVRGGIQMERVYQPIVANPNTMRQQVSRKKMQMASVLAKNLAQSIRMGFGGLANSRVSPRNLFVKGAIPTDSGCIDGATLADLEINYEKVTLTDGMQGNCPISFGELDMDTPLTVTAVIESVDKSYNSNHTAAGAEQSVAIVIVVLNKTLGASVMHTGILYNKETGTWNSAYDDGDNVAIRVPGTWQGSYVEVYAFTKLLPDALNGVDVSTFPYRIPGPSTFTAYLGTGRVA